MLKKRKVFSVFLLAAFLMTGIPGVCYGNSAEPPSILIIVPNAPEDMEIHLESGGTSAKADRTDKGIESYFTLFLWDMIAADHYTVQVRTGGDTFALSMEKPPSKYNNIYTLNWKNRTLTPGKSIWRNILLVSLRVILTLAIEAAVFWAFGYRSKRSWLAFLIINLVTQGGLNILLNRQVPVGGYVILGLLIGEVFVFLVEIIAFLVTIHEQRPFRTFLYVLTANVLSLVAGGFLITVLPL